VVGAVAHPFATKEQAELFRHFVSFQTRGCQPRFAQMMTAAGTFNTTYDTEIKIALCPQAVFKFNLLDTDMADPAVTPSDSDRDDGEEDMSF